MKTTLNAIRKHQPCSDGWKKLLQYLGKTEADDEPIFISTILKSNGVDDALWCLRAVDGHDKEIRLLAVAYARKVRHLMTDNRSIEALDVAERHAHGQESDDDLAAARAAARDAARDARDAARDAARASWDAGDATWGAGAAARAAREAAWAAVWAAARDAGAAAGAAREAAWDAGDATWGAGDAARDAEKESQATMLLTVCKTIEETEK